MSVISRILVRNILRSTCNVSCANQKGYSSQTIEENCLKSKSSDVYIPEITLAEYLVNNFSKFPNKIAVVSITSNHLVCKCSSNWATKLGCYSSNSSTKHRIKLMKIMKSYYGYSKKINKKALQLHNF